ncbi:MAG: HAMP domain-containing histidine kinase [Campylobacterales bacterium]|nr:HAMP domain-containing histidine kinase [Campylobacterales bacterium]
MKIKSFILLIYTIAGLIISALTAFMTFMIIGTPIGSKMFLQIILAIVFVLPIIMAMSYFFGKYLSKKFHFIEQRLENIKNEDFQENKNKNLIIEINDINQNMNFVSNRLDNLISDLKQKNQNLSDLLISMAHDVKTPITILNGYIEEIEDGLVKKENLPNILHNMKQEVNFLNELTVDMLEFISSMHNHKIKETITLQPFIENEIFSLLENKKELQYINAIDKESSIIFNKMDLKKIFLNILTNASKYTHNGYIKVEISSDTIILENNGEEIKKEFQEKIFEPFFTISKSKNRKTTGFGLGLSIVKNLAKNNGYNCYLKSSTKEKTIFCLERLQCS